MSASDVVLKELVDALAFVVHLLVAVVVESLRGASVDPCLTMNPTRELKTTVD